MKPCIAIDWLTLHVKVPVRDFERLDSRYKLKKADEKDLKRISAMYSIDKKEYQTRHFRAVYVILNQAGEEVATLAAQPHSEILQEDSGLFKIHNKFLYQKDLLEYTKGILKDLQLEFRSISRIDIAVDFLTFAKGLKPENFIKGYMSGKYIKRGKGKFRVSGENNKGVQFETLKFGSETSDVTYYLYNKTKELEAVKMKGWITDNWKANGWDGKQDVWRLEFSLKTTTKNVIDPDSGEQIFSFKNIDVIKQIDEVFNYHFTRHFSFVQGAKKCRKDRMKPVLLFPDKMKCEAIKINVSEKKEALRSDKIFAKKLMMLNQELRGHDFELGIFSNELLSMFVLNRNIQSWAEKKIPGFVVSEKVATVYQGIRNVNAGQPDLEIRKLIRECFSLQYRP